ncbi:MAG: hypothetical protein ABMA64_11020 [Myxococcota bacterium]
MRLLLWLAGCTGAPTSADDCIPTTGDNCDCSPKCMTQAELDRIDSFCDLGCMFDSGGSSEPNWTCEVVDDACAVVEWPTP